MPSQAPPNPIPLPPPIAPSPSATSISTALTNLKSTTSSSNHNNNKNNKHLKRLPPNYAIQTRPIIHPPIPSPYAGANVPKVVYVSTKTPFMSAVKRVRRLLAEVEKREMKAVKLVERGGGEKGLRELVAERRNDGGKDLKRKREEVLVKASGRACDRAVKVGEWFEKKEGERRCGVEVRVGSVSVVDDVVEKQTEMEGGGEEVVDEEDEGEEEQQDSKLEGGDTTMELLGNAEVGVDEKATESGLEAESMKTVKDSDVTKKRRRRKRKRPMYDVADLPEQRLRWVKTVEIAIRLKT